MTLQEDDYLQLSSIQHFAFCRRQWGLMVLEDQWEDNWRTISGIISHDRAHDMKASERRGDNITLRVLKVVSHELGLSGECDVVEFIRDDAGIELHGYEGRYSVFPVEYKRGKAKQHDADRLQLCAQAMALEEMLCASIPRGALFYGETHRREDVEFTPELRDKTREAARAMHTYNRVGTTPPPEYGKHCAACSLNAQCLPELNSKKSVRQYIEEHMEE